MRNWYIAISLFVDDVYRYISSADKGASAAAAAALANGYATESFYASYQNVVSLFVW